MSDDERDITDAIVSKAFKRNYLFIPFRKNKEGAYARKESYVLRFWRH